MYLIMVEVGVDELGLPFYEFYSVNKGEDLLKEVEHIKESDRVEDSDIKIFTRVQHGEFISWEETE